MAARRMKYKADELRKNPDKCYNKEKDSGRYKDLYEDVASINQIKSSNHIRFVCISDTHNKTNTLNDVLPDGDILIHGGDFTESSSEDEIIHFNNFLGEIKNKFKHIVVIAGNHDISFDQSWNGGVLDSSLFGIFFGTDPSQEVNSKEAKKLLTNCTYIEDETIELYGIKIYGSPWQPVFENLAFNKPRGDPILEIWDKIPSDTDILITHGPPLGIGDRVVEGNRVGCADLLGTVMDRVKPHYHIYGHIHEDYGIWNDGTTTFINASICNFMGLPVNKPVVFDYEIPR